jgi:spore germination protein GerM
MARLVVIGLVVLALAGSAAPSGGSPGRSFRVTLYFLTDDGSAPLGVRRTVVRTGYTPVARKALEALIAGPTEAERDAGLSSAIRPSVRIRSFAIPFSRHRLGETATVDFTGLPRQADDRIGTQIARTLIGVSDIARVRILANGKPWGFPSMSGGTIVPTWDYRFLLGIWVDGFKAIP